MSIISEPFDLWQIFVNELFGSVGLFILICLILILFLSIKFKIPFEATSMLAILFLAIIFTESQIPVIWTFIILVIGVLFYFTLAQLIKR